MAIPFKKFGYTINPITDEIETPQIFLVNKRLKKIGELYPVDGLRITINEVNQPDEVSFTYNKMNNDKECPYFNKIDDLSVIQVGDYGFFEVSINKKEDVSISKTVTAQSLGIVELSQINATLEINTEDDMSRSGYSSNYPTIFYREVPIGTDSETAKKMREASLLNRILSYAPHYKIGFVSPSLKYVQRTFSWSDTDIVSIFNDVATEINCIFDISVTIGENGNVKRIVNVYDMQYCDNCYNIAEIASPQTFRNIINGVCQNCGSSAHVRDIGDDTNIYISTDNLSDEITIEGNKDSIKNCLKVTGGDDTITAAVQGINMSGNRIMMFSDTQIKAMSPELIGKLDSYKKDYKANIDDYEDLLETQYDLYDVILYLQSGKMPLLETDVTTTLEALISVVKQITTHYHNKFYVSSWSNYGYSATKTSIRNLFTTFMPQGYSFTIDTDSITTTSDYDENTDYHWYGSIKIYSTENKDDYYTLYVTENSGTYIRYGKADTPISYVDTGNVIANFSVTFNFADKNQSDYISYLEQHTAYLLSETDLTYDNEKAREWDKYSYNRLVSFYDGFETCLDVINDMLLTDSENEILLNMKENYQRIQSHIKSQMDYLQDQIFALYSYLGDFSSIGAKDFIDSNGNITYELRNYSSVSNVLSRMVNSSYKGGYSYNSDGTINMNSFRPNEFIGTKPFKCKKCGSTNVSVVTDDNSNNNVCSNCGNRNLYTYLDIMQDIVNSYQKYNGKTVISERQRLQNIFNIETYINDENLYTELCSFIREDVYNNSNYISDGLSNAQIIQKARELKTKAEQELSKSCMNQYTVTSTISAIIAQKSFVYNGVLVNDDYSKFMVNNYVRVNIDNEIYKMRIASIGLTFPITDKVDVTFTNATKYNNGAMSDISSIIQNASSMSSSYNYVATQAEKGETASVQFDTIKREGLNAALMAVKGGRDQDVVIDNHGILLRKKIYETDEYSPYQMKLINRNIVMTDDNWQTAKLAIGLGTYQGVPTYGIWASLICGDLLCGNKLAIYGGGDGTGNATVVIDGDGITLDGGAITWKKKLPSSSVDGLDDTVKGFVDAIDDLQNQIDGEIITWFGDYEPTSLNKPAYDWKTNEEKNKHINDLFYNTKTGSAYKYIFNGVTHEAEWSVITDATITEALKKASKAQDTADGKRRVFVEQPIPPYDIGDLWPQGENGDLLRCKTSKKDGESFNDDDWIKASKYTDDKIAQEALNEAKKGIKNAADALARAESAETNAMDYADSQDSLLSTNITDAYKKYADSAVKVLDDSVSQYLGINGSTTIISDDYMISPYIGGGYLNVSSGNCRFIIDPKGKSGTNYICAASYNSDYFFGVKKNGSAYFKGTVVATSFVLSGTLIDSSYIDGLGDLATKNESSLNIPSNLTDLNSTRYFGFYSDGSIYASNAVISGEINASSGKIGNWDIGSYGGNDGWLVCEGKRDSCGIYFKLTTDAGYNYSSINNGTDFEMLRSNSVKFRVNTFNSKINDPDSNCLYADVGYISLKSHGTLNIISTQNMELTSNELINFNSQKGLRIYDYNSSSNYNHVNLTVTAYGSNESNSYLVNNGSMKIGYRLQIGDNNGGYDTSNALRVVGSSYVTGTSYTNSGTTVTSDKNKKNSISIPSNCYVQLFDAINFRRFKYNDGTSNRFHLGVIAQELEEAMKTVGIPSEDFGGLVIDEQGNYYVRYDEINILTALKVKQLEESINESQREIEELRNELVELKGRL